MSSDPEHDSTVPTETIASDTSNHVEEGTGTPVTNETSHEHEHHHSHKRHSGAPVEGTDSRERVECSIKNHESAEEEQPKVDEQKKDDEATKVPELAVETPQLVNNDETEEKRRLEEEQSLIEQKVAGAAQFVQDGLSALSSGDSYLDNFMQEDYKLALLALEAVLDPELPLEIHVDAVKLLSLLAEKMPELYQIYTAKGALDKWIYFDLQLKEEEVLVPALKFLTNICLHEIPEEQKKLLGKNLASLLMDIAMETHPGESGGVFSDTCLTAIHALLAVNTQFKSHDPAINRVVYALLDHKSNDNGTFAHLLITYANRYGEDARWAPLWAELIRDVFLNTALATLVFFITDTKILVEVLLRYVSDTSNDELRGLYFDTLLYVLADSLHHEFLVNQIKTLRSVLPQLRPIVKIKATAASLEKLVNLVTEAHID